MYQNKAWKQLAGLTPAEAGEKAAREENALRELAQKPFLEKLKDPRVHVLAQRAIGALYQLENLGIKITDWYFDDSGSEVEVENPKTFKKRWVQIGR